MNLFDFLDRAGQRRIERMKIQPKKPMDTRMFVASMFFLGYYALVVMIMKATRLDNENAKLVGDAMLVLGPIIGMVAQAIFRTDAREEQATLNTGKMADAMKEQAKSNTTTPDVTLQPGETAQASGD